MYYFPRLGRDASVELLARYSASAPNDVIAAANLNLDRCYWYPTAPEYQRAPHDVLERLQSGVREIASRHGYASLLSEKSKAKGTFDRDLVHEITQLAPLFPVEAAVEEVWNFVSLQLIPDVALWRWPNVKQRDEYERILGRPRNVFRRLWWRAYIFGVGDGSVAELLLEDEAVAILERTSIGGNRRVSRIIAETHLKRFGSARQRTDLLRDAMKRIRRFHAFVSFHSLSDCEIRSLVGEAFDAAQLSLTRHH